MPFHPIGRHLPDVIIAGSRSNTACVSYDVEKLANPLPPLLWAWRGVPFLLFCKKSPDEDMHYAWVAVAGHQFEAGLPDALEPITTKRNTVYS